jgi:3-deoxy-D-manno-octulosonic-acid transferase
MENFAALTRHLLEADAAKQIPDGAALTAALRTLLNDAGLRDRIGQSAREVLEPHQGATARTAEKLAL